jgi:hypothetical protein
MQVFLWREAKLRLALRRGTTAEEVLLSDFGLFLRGAAAKVGISSQRELRDRLGDVTRHTVGGWYQGRQTPRKSSLERLSQVLELDAEGRKELYLRALGAA